MINNTGISPPVKEDKTDRNNLAYSFMVILMLLLLGSLGLSVLNLFYLLVTGNSSMFMAAGANGESQERHLDQWFTIGASIVIFTFFTLGYILPVGRQNWRSAGATQAFIIALFTEMFGIPLTIYAISGALGGAFKLSHGDHLLARGIAVMAGADTENIIVLMMALSLLILIAALTLIFLGWKEIYHGKGQLVTSGIYRHLRHPQYAGIFLFIFAWLIQWPTIITVMLAPVLVFTYYRLARREERELKNQFGVEYVIYEKTVPMFIPRFFTGTNSSKTMGKYSERNRDLL